MGSIPIRTTMNRAVELITQRNADNGDERPIYSFIVRWRNWQTLYIFWKEIGIVPTLNQIKDFTGSNPVLTTRENRWFADVYNQKTSRRHAL